MRLLISDLQRWNGLYDKIIQAHDLLLKNYGRHTVITILSGRKDDEVRYLKYEQRIVNYAKDLWRSSTIGDAFQKVFTAWKLSSLQCVPFSPALLKKPSFRNLEDGKKLEFFTELRELLIHTEISQDVAHRADITFPKREGINTARLNSRKLLKKFIARSSAADSEAKARDSATELSDCDGDGGGSGGKEEVAPGADADAAPPSTKKLRSDCEPFPQFPLVMSAASCAAVSPTDSPASAEEEKEDEVNELKKQLAEAGPQVQALVNELKKQLAEARHQVQALSTHVQILSAPAELQDLKGTAHDAAAAEPASESVNMDVSLVAEMMVELSNVPSLDVQASAAAGGTGMVDQPASAPVLSPLSLQGSEEQSAFTVNVPLQNDAFGGKGSAAYTTRVTSRSMLLSAAMDADACASKGESNEIQIKNMSVVKIGICGLSSIRHCVSQYRVMVTCGLRAGVVDQELKNCRQIPACGQRVIVYSMGDTEIEDSARGLSRLKTIATHSSMALFEDIHRTAGDGGVLFHCKHGRNRSAMMAAMYVLFVVRRDLVNAFTPNSIMSELRTLAAPFGSKRSLFSDAHGDKNFAAKVNDFQKVLDGEMFARFGIKRVLDEGIPHKLQSTAARSLAMLTEDGSKRGRFNDGWFNDEVINLYFRSIVRRFRTNTFKMLVMGTHPILPKSSSSSARRPDIKRVFGVDDPDNPINFDEEDLVLAPLHMDGNHWCLLALFMK